MPGTVEDFMHRFGGGGAIDDREAEQYYDRFASTHPNDREFDNATMSQGATEYLGQLPDEHFEHAAQQAYAQAPPAQQQGLLSSLFGALQGRGWTSGGCKISSGCPPSARTNWDPTSTRGWPITPGTIIRTSSRPWAIRSSWGPWG